MHQGTKLLTVTAVNRFNRPPAGGYGRLQVMTERLRAVTVMIMKLPTVKAGYGTLSAHEAASIIREQLRNENLYYVGLQLHFRQAVQYNSANVERGGHRPMT
ncbi:MAG: hypothetical protein GY820_47075 [Gammaproteobacteria bacterium]|nr:hypothetical protein [Gammaproteobacteria bacterium]